MPLDSSTESVTGLMGQHRLIQGRLIVAKKQLNHWVSVAVNLSVVAGIVFLGIELRQNNALLASEARHHLLENQVEAITQSYDNEHVMGGWLKSEAGQEISAEERFALLRYNYSLLRKFEWEYRQYRNGLIEEEDFPINAYIDIFTTQPLMSETWQRYRLRQSEDFRSFIEAEVVGRTPRGH